MEKSITIALDVMGGDLGADASIPAAVAMLEEIGTLDLILVGRREVIEAKLKQLGSNGRDRLSISAATEIVEMDEHPRDALRKKKDSSMRVAINLVKEGRAHACVSSGNTGALVATARFLLRTIPGVDRPAIMSAVPALGGHTHMLDLGANAYCTADQLFQFAVMGSVVASDVYGIAKPRVGLLNIGEEDIKGNDIIREAAGKLTESTLNYIGYVEGDDIFSGEVDVVVSDGFTGNVALKTMEGVAHLIATLMREEFSRNAVTKFLGLCAQPVLHSFKEKLDPRLYNGASLVGLNRIVIKSHGAADQVAFQNAIRTAALEVDKGVPKHISKLLGEHAG